MASRLPLISLLAASVCQPLGAQTLNPSPAWAIEDRIVAELLNSGDSARQAWGAHLAGNYGQTKSVPQLRRLLTSWHPDIQLQAVDSLIRLDAAVPLDELLAVWPNHREGVIILLAKDPEQNREALRSLTKLELHNLEWIALHSLLASMKAPGLAADLLRALSVELTVWVAETDKFGVQPGGGGGASACGGIGSRPGFPPLFFYRLHQNPAPGDVLLAPGLHPIYYRRQRNPSGAEALIDRALFRHEYLAQMLDSEPQSLPLQAKVSRHMIWRNEEEYLATLRTLHADTEARFRKLPPCAVSLTALAAPRLTPSSSLRQQTPTPCRSGCPCRCG